LKKTPRFLKKKNYFSAFFNKKGFQKEPLWLLPSRIAGKHSNPIRALYPVLKGGSTGSRPEKRMPAVPPFIRQYLASPRNEAPGPGRRG